MHRLKGIQWDIDYENEVSEKQILDLSLEEKKKLIPSRYINFLDDRDFSTLTNNELLELYQLKKTTWENHQKFLTPQQIAKFDSKELCELLADGQLKFTTLEQVQYLKPRQLEKLKGIIDKNQWPTYQAKIAPGQIKEFHRSEQFDLLSEEQFKAVEPDQVHRLSLKNLKMLHKKKFGTEGWENYRGKINYGLIPSFDSKEHFDFLSDGQFQHVTSDKTHLMSADQLLLLYKKNDINWHLFQGKITGLQIKSFTKSEHFDLLTYGQFQENILPSQVQYLKTKKNIRKCGTDTKLLHELKGDKIDLIRRFQLKYLSDEQLPFLKKEKLIREVSIWKVQHLVRDQLRKRSRTQWAVYTLGVITLGLVCSVIAIIARLILVPYIIRKIHPRLGNWIFAKVDANPYRLYRYFKEYTFPTKLQI